MTKLIVISGTPGTGKSTLAVALCKEMNFQRLDLHDHYQDISTGFDKEKDCYDIDLKKLEKLVKTKIAKSKKTIVLDSHIAHFLPKELVKLCIILTCNDLKELKKRLKAKKYSTKKVQENIDVEIMQVCLGEAKEQQHNIITQDTSTHSIKQIMTKIKPKIRSVSL